MNHVGSTGLNWATSTRRWPTSGSSSRSQDRNPTRCFFSFNHATIISIAFWFVCNYCVFILWVIFVFCCVSLFSNIPVRHSAVVVFVLLCFSLEESRSRLRLRPELILIHVTGFQIVALGCPSVMSWCRYIVRTMSRICGLVFWRWSVALKTDSILALRIGKESAKYPIRIADGSFPGFFPVQFALSLFPSWRRSGRPGGTLAETDALYGCRPDRSEPFPFVLHKLIDTQRIGLLYETTHRIKGRGSNF